MASHAAAYGLRLRLRTADGPVRPRAAAPPARAAEEFGRPHGPHKAKIVGSNPPRATQAHRAPRSVINGKARHFIPVSFNGKTADC